MSQAIWWRRLARRIWPHGALARRSDRVEGLLIAGCVTMALLLVPVAGAIASEVNAAEQEQAVQQARERHPVNAVLLADAPAAGAYSWSESLARWTGADGKPVQATIRTTPGTRAGSPVTAWLDASGVPTSEPMSPQTAQVTAAAAGMGFWTGAAAVLLVIFLLARAALNRRRLAAWGTAWRQTEPQWSRRSGETRGGER